MKKFYLLTLIILTLLFFNTCKGGNHIMKIKIETTGFNESGYIPTKFTCDGEDISPKLSWSKVPEKTRSIAIICDDPDAPMGTWVHWVVYNIPPEKNSLKENFPKVRKTKEGILQGLNDFRRIGYNGPCPPPGKAHRYFFKIYALDTTIEGEALTKSELLKKMEGHILGYGELIGLYKR